MFEDFLTAAPVAGIMVLFAQIPALHLFIKMIFAIIIVILTFSCEKFKYSGLTVLVFIDM